MCYWNPICCFIIEFEESDFIFVDNMQSDEQVGGLSLFPILVQIVLGLHKIK